VIRILMVEDDTAQIELTRAQSAQLKLLYELDAVTSAEAALELLRGHGERSRPDLLLIDLNLPGMSGAELVDELKVDPVLSSIPVVVLSAVEPSRTVLLELKKHARACVEKPLGIESWLKIVKAVPGLGFSLIKLPAGPSGK
jgi:two-component system, chemotaxis family, response regulator Rcp1